MKTILTPRNFFNCFQDDSRQFMQVLQDLYDSEINFRISTFWDAGFDVELGLSIVYFKNDAAQYYDERISSLNENPKENFRTFREAVKWLAEIACEIYPNSKFAKQYKVEI